MVVNAVVGVVIVKKFEGGGVAGLLLAEDGMGH